MIPVLFMVEPPFIGVNNTAYRSAPTFYQQNLDNEDWIKLFKENMAGKIYIFWKKAAANATRMEHVLKATEDERQALAMENKVYCYIKMYTSTVQIYYNY